MVRLKGSVAQIRAQCATDIRRRDVEIQRLKRHLEGRRGREGNGGQVGVVVITPGPSKAPQGNRNGESGTDLDSPAYSLKQETTEFLTQLSQSLSDENDALIGLVRGTLATLRSLQGLPESGEIPNLASSPEGTDNVNECSGSPPSYEALATSTDEVLEHLRGLLTNPSFVPLEEVEVREEEIHRLRDGWEKMASRWKEAMALLDGWRKRMVDTGDTIDLNDLKMGMELGSEIPTAQEARERSLLKPDEEADANESDILQDLQDNSEQPPSPEAEQISGIDLELHATDKALSARDPNAGPTPSPQRLSFEPIAEEDSKVLAAEDDIFLLHFPMNKASRESPRKVRSRIPLQVSRKSVYSKVEYSLCDRLRSSLYPNLPPELFSRNWIRHKLRLKRHGSEKRVNRGRRVYQNMPRPRN